MVCHVSRPTASSVVRDDDAQSLRGQPAFCNGRASALAAAHDGIHALESAGTVWPDLVLTSLVLAGPVGSGGLLPPAPAVVSVPVVMLTGADSPSEPEVGFTLGADAYVVWPQRKREMVARLRAVLRRGQWLLLRPQSCTNRSRSGGLYLDPCGFEAHGQPGGASS